MKRRVLVLLTLALTTASVFAAETQRYLVSTRTAPRDRALRVMSNAAGDQDHRRVRTMVNMNVFAADLTDDEVAALKASGEIELIEPVVERHILGFEGGEVPVDATAINYSIQQVVPYGIPLVGAPDVWPVTRGSQNVHVAVIDTGIDYEHPDLVHAYAGGYNVLAPEATPMDDNNHGTHVAGTIAAADNNFGVVGVAPNVKLWAVKILNSQGKGSSEGLVAALDWLITKSKEVGGRWVVNLSLGSRSGSEIEKAAIGRALGANIIIVAAAGNTGKQGLQYPAGYEGVIAVGAVGSDSKLASFSTWGVGMTVVAPGAAVTSSFRAGTHTTADVVQAESAITGAGIEGSPFGSVTGRFVDCGLGRPEDFPANMAGRIALIQRGGELEFRVKAKNAKAAGAAAVVIYNTIDKPDTLSNWTLVPRKCDPVSGYCGVGPEWEGFEFPLTIGISTADGEKAKAFLNKNTTVGFRIEDYGQMSGTSMATPHVAGAVALLLSLAPNLNTAQMLLTLEQNSKDLEEKGWDMRTAWGLIDLPKAGRAVNPGAFGQAPTDPNPPTRRRGVRH